MFLFSFEKSIGLNFAMFMFCRLNPITSMVLCSLNSDPNWPKAKLQSSRSIIETAWKSSFKVNKDSYYWVKNLCFLSFIYERDFVNVGDFFVERRWQRNDIKSWDSSKRRFSSRYSLHNELSSWIIEWKRQHDFSVSYCSCNKSDLKNSYPKKLAMRIIPSLHKIFRSMSSYSIYSLKIDWSFYDLIKGGVSS